MPDDYVSDPLGYLLKRRFGEAAYSVPTCGLEDDQALNEQQLYAARDAYRAELEALSECHDRRPSDAAVLIAPAHRPRKFGTASPPVAISGLIDLARTRTDLERGTLPKNLP